MSKALKRKMNEALSYDQWKEAALAYDKHYGLNRWKENELSRRYDFEAISLRLEELKLKRQENLKTIAVCYLLSMKASMAT